MDMVAVFFKASWEIVGTDVIQAVKEFFEEGIILKQLNATLLSLIPKTSAPRDASEYRPIACCNVVYKCISKVLCGRLKKVLDDLVDDNQGAFVAGRYILHNVLLSKELIRLDNRGKISARCMMKIDLIKAYDSVDWMFLREMMQGYGFPPKFANWIKEIHTSFLLTLDNRLRIH